MLVIAGTVPARGFGALIIAAVFLSAGCGAIRRSIESAGEEPPVDPDAILVFVRNNLTPPTALTVYVITDTGTRTRLGTMTGSTTDRFVVDVPPVGRARFYGICATGAAGASYYRNGESECGFERGGVQPSAN